jgi:hypothetical protein
MGLIHELIMDYDAIIECSSGISMMEKKTIKGKIITNSQAS